MNQESPLFKQVTIIGVGLIGGSLGMAIKKNRVAQEVVGLSHRHTSLVYALKNNAIDKAFYDIKKAVEHADLVVMATPVNSIVTLLPTVARFLKRGCVVTDVGSTKAVIVETAEKNLTSAFFVGSHPLAGSEKRGAEFASPDLFQNSLCIMTPNERTNRFAEERVRALWTRLGADVKTLAPPEHDKILAYISHLPHLVAYALMGAIPSEYLPYGAQGLKDTTRIASSSVHMWNDICMMNSKNVIHSLDELVKTLSLLRKYIIARDEQNLFETFRKAKAKRDTLDSPSKDTEPKTSEQTTQVVNP